LVPSIEPVSLRSAPITSVSAEEPVPIFALLLAWFSDRGGRGYSTALPLLLAGALRSQNFDWGLFSLLCTMQWRRHSYWDELGSMKRSLVGNVQVRCAREYEDKDIFS